MSNNELETKIKDLEKKLRACEKREEIYKDACHFYASPSSWGGQSHFIQNVIDQSDLSDRNSNTRNNSVIVGGKTARQALAEALEIETE